MKFTKIPSPESPTVSDSSHTGSKSSKKWIWGTLGIMSALALGVAVSRFGLPSLKRKQTSSGKSVLPTGLTAEWQLIEKIDRTLQKAQIQGIDVYVKNGKVLLVAAPEQQHDLADARDVILALDGVHSVEISIKAPSTPSSFPTSNHARNFAQ